MATIGKPALIRDIADSVGFSQVSVGQVLDALIGAIQKHTAAGDDVNVAGLGKFVLKTRAARQGRNPHTGEVIHLPETTSLAFRPTKARKD